MEFLNWPQDCLVNNVATINCLPTVALNVTNAFLVFAGTVAIFIIVWEGIRMIMSGGDTKQIESQRRAITFAIVGLIVVLSSYAILFFIGYITKTTNCITDVNKILTGCT